MKAWLERWQQKRHRESGALIAVFHPAYSSIAHASNTALLLGRAAMRADMDFICRTTGKPSASGAPEIEPGTLTAHPNLPVTFTGNSPISSTGWGLND